MHGYSEAVKEEEGMEGEDKRKEGEEEGIEGREEKEEEKGEDEEGEEGKGRTQPSAKVPRLDRK